jgi:UDP-N-acetyl-D-glucosamine dehydrogenase
VSSEQELIAKAEDRSAIFGVIGLGYVGLPLCLEVARAGFRVIGFDIQEPICARINAGESHVGDVPSEALAEYVGKGLIEATRDMSRLSEPDIISICVPTPLSKTRDPDIAYVLAVGDRLEETVRVGQAIVLESTTYPGTTRELLLPRVEKSGLRVGKDVFLAFSPERVDPGNPTWQTRNTPKVIGGLTDACRRVVAALYGPVFDTLVPVESPESAELVKLLENTFRSVNIGLANEMAIVCDKLGVDVWNVIDAASTKPFGFMKFSPGPGLGGHCIPIDPHYLAWKMRGLNYKTRFIDVASEVNSEMPAFWVRKVAEQLNEDALAVRRSRVLVIGVAYKRDIEDKRESPALDIIRLLRQQGADVRYHDPYVSEITDGGDALKSVDLNANELAKAACVVIATDHSRLDYRLIQEHAKRVVDTRNALRRNTVGA